MADSKWDKTLAALNYPTKEPPTVLLPVKAPIPSGKRSTPGWKQKSVLLKEESVDRANELLKRRGDRTDFSDLMQALLDAWLNTPNS
jgi:hypothetical protein